MPDNERNGNAAAIAAAARLVWCSDEEAGIRRIRAGRGFAYRDAGGRKVTDAGTLDRIRALVIPPAWTDVWIAPKANCHIQATGRDARGRKQYRYHPRWTEERGETKFSTLGAFCGSLPALRKAVDRDLRRHGVTREKVLAAIVWLLDNAMIRIGNAAYAKENGSFGLTTLRDRHAAVSGSTLRLSFKGKSGKDWNLKITDRRVARAVKGAQDLPGQQLFQYVDAEGRRRSVKSEDVNDYIRANCCGDFTSKHFRTWGGTVMAAALFDKTELPDSEAGRRRARNGVIDQVAKQLGNTRAVCRTGYIHPRVIDDWDEGRLTSGLEKARAGVRRAPKGMDRGEAVVRRWLERNPRR